MESSLPARQRNAGGLPGRLEHLAQTAADVKAKQPLSGIAI
jgi:hypothetical protein